MLLRSTSQFRAGPRAWLGQCARMLGSGCRASDKTPSATGTPAIGGRILPQPSPGLQDEWPMATGGVGKTIYVVMPYPNVVRRARGASSFHFLRTFTH